MLALCNMRDATQIMDRKSRRSTIYLPFMHEQSSPAPAIGLSSQYPRARGWNIQIKGLQNGVVIPWVSGGRPPNPNRDYLWWTLGRGRQGGWHGMGVGNGSKHGNRWRRIRLYNGQQL